MGEQILMMMLRMDAAVEEVAKCSSSDSLALGREWNGTIWVQFVFHLLCAEHWCEEQPLFIAKVDDMLVIPPHIL
jgi:hypothetical protein